MCPHTISEYLTPVVNEIFYHADIPQSLNNGVTHPIQKRNKDKIIPGNYRGITISPIITKIMDSISLPHQQREIYFEPDNLQFGFSENRSGTFAAFILNECIADSMDSKRPLYIASLDVVKAFDVVRHESLLNKLYERGMSDTWWRMKHSSYKNMSTRVIWEGETSKPIYMLQGNRQGALPSPHDYKTYRADDIAILDQPDLGYHIGELRFPCPTVADDMLLLARSPLELQTMISLTETYANDEHFKIHPEKKRNYAN